ncbi:MAG: lipopolysaccharide biosynthesis protein [Acidimicrobiales bacterium]
MGSAASQLASTATSLLLIPVVLATLGSAVYGAWIVLSTLMVLASLADLGVRSEVMRRTAAAIGSGRQDSIESIIGQGLSAIGISLLIVVTPLLILSPHVVRLAVPSSVVGGSRSTLTGLFVVLLITLSVNVLLTVPFSAMRGMQRGYVEDAIRVVSTVCSMGLTISVLLWSQSLWALAVGQVANTAGLAAGITLALRSHLGPGARLRVGRLTWAQFGGWMTLSGLLLMSQLADVIDSQWDKIVLSRVVGLGAVTALHIGTTMVLALRAIALVPIVPLIASTAELRLSNPQLGDDVFRACRTAVHLLGFSLLATIALTAESVLGLWLPDGYGRAGDVAALFSVAMGVNLCTAALSMRAIGEGKHRLIAASAATNVVVNAISSLWLALNIGLLGVVWGSVIGNACGVAVMHLGYRRLDNGPRWPFPFRSIAAALVLTFVVRSLVDSTAMASLRLLSVSVGHLVVVGGAISLLNWRDTEHLVRTIKATR